MAQAALAPGGVAETSIDHDVRECCLCLDFLECRGRIITEQRRSSTQSSTWPQSKHLHSQIDAEPELCTDECR